MVIVGNSCITDKIVWSLNESRRQTKSLSCWFKDCMKPNDRTTDQTSGTYLWSYQAVSCDLMALCGMSMATTSFTNPTIQNPINPPKTRNACLKCITKLKRQVERHSRMASQKNNDVDLRCWWQFSQSELTNSPVCATATLRELSFSKGCFLF